MGVEAGKVVLVEVEVGEVERRPATVDCSGEPSSNLWFLIKMIRITRMMFRIIVVIKEMIVPVPKSLNIKTSETSSLRHNYKASLAPECESGFLLSGGYT